MANISFSSAAITSNPTSAPLTSYYDNEDPEPDTVLPDGTINEPR